MEVHCHAGRGEYEGITIPLLQEVDPLYFGWIFQCNIQQNSNTVFIFDGVQICFSPIL